MNKEGLAMVRVPACCEKQVGLKKGPWTPEEDHKLITYIQTHGHSSWRALPKQAGLSRCGKSCRLRWTNYLRPGIKRGNFSPQEENSIIHLHAILGNRWSTIATHLPGRTDNEIKNHWNTRLRKRLLKMGIDPTTHRPWPVLPPPPPPPPPAARTQLPAINTLLLSLLHPQASLPSTTTADPSALLKSLLFPAAPPPMPDHVPPASAAPSPSPFPPINPTTDPALLAAAETRLVLDCLKVCSAHDSHSSSDHHLNQLITRLLLVKFLQQGSSNYGAPSFPSFDISKAPIHRHVGAADPRMSSPVSADHLLFNQGLHSMLGAHILSHESTTAAPTAPVSAYMNHDLSAPVNCNGTGSHNNACGAGVQLPMTMSVLSSSNSYQQRLLQALPFLAESLQIEPCTSINAADDLSSNQLRHASQLNSSPPSSAASLPCQQWPAATAGADNHTTTPGVPQLLSTNLMAWEELLMRGAPADRDNIANACSSSTVNNSSSSSSTLSSASAAAPPTPANHFNNVQDYWSNLLNLISPNINHHS